MLSFIARFDAHFMQLIQSLPNWVYSPMLFVTFVGQPAIVIFFAIIIAIFGIMQHNTKLVFASVVVPVTIGFNTLLKLAFQRDRPLTEYAQNMLFSTPSFPSGHATASMIGFGFMAYVAWSVLPQPVAIVVVILLALLIIAVGVSRVYLGAHFPSDVLAGWIVGAVALSVIIFIIKPFAVTN